MKSDVDSLRLDVRLEPDELVITLLCGDFIVSSTSIGLAALGAAILIAVNEDPDRVVRVAP